MAPKRSSLLEDQPAAAASSSKEDVESEEEEEVVKEQAPAEEAEVSAGDNESDPDDSDDTDGNISTKKPKPSDLDIPIVKSPKPKPKPKKPASKSTTNPSATTGKRPLDSENVEKDSKVKKKKKMMTEVDDGEKGSENLSVDVKVNRFGRNWSDADEIVLLNTLIYYKEKGIDYNSDLDGILESIKSSVSYHANKEQLSAKIRRLRSKYRTSMIGRDGTFSKPHDAQCYELMKIVFGEETKSVVDVVDDGNGGKTANQPKTRGGEVSARQKKKTGEWRAADKELEEGYLSRYPFLNDSVVRPNTVSNSLLNNVGLSFLGDSKVHEFKLKQRNVEAAALELRLKCIELEREQISAALDALKTANS